MDESGPPDGLFCSAGDCLEDAVAHGQVTLEVGARAGAVRGEERQTFSLPLCRHHAHLLGFGNTIATFSNGLLDDTGRR